MLTSEINPDGPVVIRKSLTLKGVDRSLEPQLPFIGIGEDGAAVDVTVQDVRVLQWVRVGFDTAPGGHTVTLRRISVGKGEPNANGITFDTQSPASFTLEQSYVRNSGGSSDNALHLFAEDPDGLVSMRIVGNRLTTRGNSESGSGIDLAAIGDGSVRATIHNNAIWDVGRCVCGAAAGISVLPYGQIRADVDIVGNTIELSQTDGIQQRNMLTGVGRLTLDVYDNIISHTDFFAIRLDTGDPGTFRFRGGYNARYQTLGLDLDGQSAGSGNRSVNPRYVNRAAGDLRLRADSPLIDKGLVCTPGGISIREAAGRHRLKGGSVDIGAYERDAGSVSGVVRLGTSGPNTLTGTTGKDILCGFGGNDTLCAKDGKRGDYADGGSGRDKARSDSGDIRRSIEVSGGSC